MSTAAVGGGDLRAAPLTPSTPAGIVVRTYINEQVDVLNRTIGQIQRDTPGSVGLTRTTIHRIRTAIRGYRHLFADPPHGGPQLDQLLASLKHAEDLEALRVHFIDRFDQLDLAPKERPRWYATLKAEQNAAYRQIHRIGTQTWVAALLGQVRVFADSAEFTREGAKPASSLTGTLTRTKAHLLHTYAQLPHAEDLQAAREELRQTARRSRSMAEAVEPALGRVAAEMIAPIVDLEHLLEHYRRVAVARTWLLRLPGADRARPLTATLIDLEQRELHRTGEQIDQAAAVLIERWS
jgi:CHAD domain-containing protein